MSPGTRAVEWPPAPLTALRGRDAELETIAEHVGAAAAGRGGVVLVEGPAGIGKSRLLTEAARLAGAAGLTVAAGAADELEAVAPLGTLLDALRGGDWPVLAAADLRGLESIADRPFEVLDRLEALLRAHAERRPLLVSFDDVQWTDALTLLALGTLPLELTSHPVLWIVSRWPVAITPPLQLMLDRLEGAGATPLAVAPLAAEDMAALARDVLGAVPSAGLLEQVEGAAGSPAYAVELLRGLMAEDRIEMVGGRAGARGGALPARLRAAIEAHLRPLSAAARHLLDAGSVLGPVFTARQAATVLGRAPEELLLAAEEVVAAQLLVKEDAHLAFRAGLVRRTVYDGLAASLQHALHRDAGRLVLAEGGSRVQAASHLSIGAAPGDEEAIAILRQAAYELSVTSPGAAADMGLRALGLLPTDDARRPQLLALVVQLLGSVGRTREAEELALTALNEDLDPESEAAVRLGVATGLVRGGRDAEAVHHIRRGLERCAPSGLLRANLLAAQATVLVQTDPRHAGEVADEAIREGEAAGSQGPVVSGLLVHGVVALRGGRLERALALAREAVGRGDAGTTGLRHPRRLLALALMGLSRFDEALAVAADGRRVGEELGSAWFIGICDTLAALAHLGAGRLDDARALATSALAVAEDVGLDAVEAQALDVLGEVAVRQGDLARARACVERLRHLAYDPRGLVSYPGWSAALLTADDEPAASLRALEDALAQLRRRFVLGVIDASRLAQVVRIAIRAGDPAKAAIAAAAARRLAQRNRGQPSIAGSAAHAEGLLNGDVARLAEAVELLRAAPRPLPLAAALEDLGLALAAGGSRNRALLALEEAHRIFLGVGATSDAARLRSLLRRSGVRRRSTSAQARSLTGWESLTESELLTVRLVAEGLTNRAVANRLFISPHTVNTHLRHAFSKLRVRSRVDLTRLVVARRGGESPLAAAPSAPAVPPRPSS